MNISLWVRNNITDRANRPLRRQISDLIPDGADVMDIGCANGRLLHHLAPRINSGLGLDLDEKMIDYAVQKSRETGNHRLRFRVQDVTANTSFPDFVATHIVMVLILHALPTDEARHLLEELNRFPGMLIIADFVRPDSRFQRAFLHFDEWLAGHHDRYVAYTENGGMPALLSAADIPVRQEMSSRIPGVHIWVCR